MFVRDGSYICDGDLCARVKNQAALRQGLRVCDVWTSAVFPEVTRTSSEASTRRLPSFTLIVLVFGGKNRRETYPGKYNKNMSGKSYLRLFLFRNWLNCIAVFNDLSGDFALGNVRQSFGMCLSFADLFGEIWKRWGHVWALIGKCATRKTYVKRTYADPTQRNWCESAKTHTESPTSILLFKVRPSDLLENSFFIMPGGISRIRKMANKGARFLKAMKRRTQGKHTDKLGNIRKNKELMFSVLSFLVLLCLR